MEFDDVYRICELIDEHSLSNIFELQKFIDENQGRKGIPKKTSFKKVIEKYSELIIMEFEAVRQQKKRGTRSKSNKSKTDVLLREIVSWIQKTGCTEFADLVTYARDERFDDWFTIVRKQTIFLTEILASFRRKHSY